MSPRLMSVVTAWIALGCGSSAPQPAHHVCYDLSDGTRAPLTAPTQVFGAGLTYAEHLQETGQRPDSSGFPPIFTKGYSPTQTSVAVPSPSTHATWLDRQEPGLSKAVADHGLTLQPLVDYEVELGMVLLEEIQEGEPPVLGFFVANDLSERALAVLGEGQADRMGYWGMSKSGPGFLPVGTEIWRPNVPVQNGLPCVMLKTTVDGEVRQEQSTRDLVYTTSTLVDAAEATAGEPLSVGTWILTGTPSGVALATPAWKLMAANLIGLDRFQRLGAVLDSADRFLQPGNEVSVSAEGLGEATITIIAAPQAIESTSGGR
ncbi:MAG: fumarylacetoacetate hydrolase family protein [Myxococcota bacterium]